MKKRIYKGLLIILVTIVCLMIVGCGKETLTDEKTNIKVEGQFTEGASITVNNSSFGQDYDLILNSVRIRNNDLDKIFMYSISLADNNEENKKFKVTVPLSDSENIDDVVVYQWLYGELVEKKSTYKKGVVNIECEYLGLFVIALSIEEDK